MAELDRGLMHVVKGLLQSMWAATAGRRAAVLAIMLAGVVCACSGAGYGGTLIVETTPSDGAFVIVNGEPWGQTPLTLEGLPPGRVLVQVTMEGYRDAMVNAVVPERDGEERLVIEMTPRTGWVTINSQPEGALITLDDGTELGTTPIMRRMVPSGELTYRLELEDYEPLTHTLTVHEDLLASANHRLDPRPAVLKVVSEPERANILINRRMRDEVTPAEFSLRPGTYVVGLQVEGFVEAERSITLGPNEEQTLEFELNVGDAPPGMVLVPAGEFIAGENNAAPDERPRRRVHLDAFYIDKYAVTNRQYQAVARSHTFPDGEEDFPVTGVTYEQARAFASAVGKRLPTELEWEKAARGTDGRTYPWGNHFDRDLCNSAMSRTVELREVGRYPGGHSPYGVADMAGNVKEWTSSWYQAYPGNPDVTKEYGQLYRVLRGGSFKSEPFDLRVARRHFDRPDAVRDDYGFRCVMDLDDWDGRDRR